MTANHSLVVWSLSRFDRCYLSYSFLTYVLSSEKQLKRPYTPAKLLDQVPHLMLYYTHMQNKKPQTVPLTKDPRDDAQTPDPQSPAVSDSQTWVGHMPDPDVDEDVLDVAHDVGLYSDATEDEAEELDIAGQVDKAEKFRRGS